MKEKKTVNCARTINGTWGTNDIEEYNPHSNPVYIMIRKDKHSCMVPAWADISNNNLVIACVIGHMSIKIATN